jgi:hypothetical protein
MPPSSRTMPRPAMLVACALVAVGCGSAPEAPRVVRLDSAGVELVVNRGGDRPAELAVERTFSVGGADTGPEAFFNVGRGAVAIDDAGLLYILDRGNHRVVVFDAEGIHVRTFGRQGGGPGELLWPMAIAAADDGSVGISDVGHRGLVRLTSTGEPLGTRPLEGWSGGGMAVRGDGVIMQLRDLDPENSRDNLVHLGPDGQQRKLVSMERPPARPIDLGCVQISGLPQLFAPSLVWAAGGDRLAVVTSPAYEIDVYKSERLATRIRRDVAPRPATRELAIQEVGDDFRVGFGTGGGCSAPASKVVDERGFADVLPAIRRMALSPDGTLWVQRFAVRGDPATVDVFAADGTYLGALDPGTPFPDAFYPDGRFVTTEKDDLDLDHVVAYRLTGP